MTHTLSTTPGYASAAQPINDSPIHTTDEGLDTGETCIPSRGESMPAFFARPHAQTGGLPIVIVIQEIFGVHEHIRDICCRLAHQGYLAVAPELYFRQGNPCEYSDIPTLFSELVQKVPDNQVLSDLDHTASWASRHGGDANRLAVTGFCWGGRIAWLYAAHNPQLKAAVAWYGRLMGDKSLNSPKHPVDVALNLTAPVLGLYGGQDTGISQQSIALMRQTLQGANVNAEIIVYPEAGHAFFADYRPSFHKLSAEDGWQQMLAWFARYVNAR